VIASQPMVKDGGHFHAVQFYPNSQALARLVSRFIGEGFASGLPAIVIATPEHRELIKHELAAASFDVDQLEGEGTLLMLDAGTVLSAFMVDGMPDATRFRQTMIPIIERVCRGRADCVIRTYGEMVDVLWKAGKTVAAVRLETLWNELAQTHAFALLCGYAMGSFYKDAAQEEICRHHTHVLSPGGELGTVQ
jgi:hypothetical protein